MPPSWFIVVVVLEYSVSQSRVITRGVFTKEETEKLEFNVPKLTEENTQNHVNCFLNIAKGYDGTGFTGLVPW
jgi:hypothetical protein